MKKSNVVNLTFTRFNSYYLIFLMVFLRALAFAQDIAINEVMASNNAVVDDEDGDYPDRIELYNYGSSPVNLNGFGISDDVAEPYQWIFPAYTMQPGEFLLVWASNKDRTVAGQPLHTNFKISSSGEPIVLTNNTGGVVDQSVAVALQTDVSYGRQPDGTGPWLFFYTSTPGASNTGVGLTELLVPPSFSHASGFYSAGFNLTLSHSNPNATIIYTTDGSEPSPNALSGVNYNYKNQYSYQPGSSVGPLLTDNFTAQTYASAINVYDKSAEPDEIAAKNTLQKDIYVPNNPVRKSFVVKARAYVNGIGSATVANTYFVWSQGNPYDIPVLSIQIQEDYLFDYDDGIYTAGVDFDDWRAANPNNTQQYRPEWNNYWRRGRVWEYPANIELFESNANALNSVMKRNGGLRIHGNNSRARGIKNWVTNLGRYPYQFLVFRRFI